MTFFPRCLDERVANDKLGGVTPSNDVKRGEFDEQVQNEINLGIDELRKTGSTDVGWDFRLKQITLN